MDYQLDLRQYICPLPLLMAKKALNNLPHNSILTIQLNEQSAVQDFELLCQQQGYQFISWQKFTALDTQIVIRKG
ncbi:MULTISPECIES: sulfurtransferase TusA family protein [unclassified Lonepinella]|uniref:sulfurtransferase TusA family protein n=1 Tax=unclassified Lonepinella TaxID=2642006 RepID=UPI0036DB79CE